MEYDQALLERVNPVFNTAKMTTYNLASTGDKDAKAICDSLGLTFDTTQNSSTTDKGFMMAGILRGDKY